ncbi:MAG: hypothetical protein AB8B68_04875 [Rickettsiaceae bacterium]
MAGIEPGFVVKITKEAIKLNCKKLFFYKKKLKKPVNDKVQRTQKIAV